MLLASSDAFVAALFEDTAPTPAAAAPAAAATAAAPAAAPPAAAPAAAESSGRRASAGRKEARLTVGAQFARQLGSLMRSLGQTGVHYVRCVKP